MIFQGVGGPDPVSPPLNPHMSLQTFEQYNFLSVCNILVNNTINKMVIQDYNAISVRSCKQIGSEEKVLLFWQAFCKFQLWYLIFYLRTEREKLLEIVEYYYTSF